MMKKPSLMHITALIMIGIYLYSIVTQLSSLAEHNDYVLCFTSYFHDLYSIMIIVFSIFGVIAGTGLYFYKQWSQLLSIFIATFFLFLSLQGLLIIAFSNKNLAKIGMELITYLLFATWCLYYLNRSDVDDKFKKIKPNNENIRINNEDSRTKKPRGIKITAILLIIIYGYHIISFISAILRIPKLPDSADSLIFIIFYHFIIPLMGFISGIGLITMRYWARKITVIFSIIATTLYLQFFFIYNDGFTRIAIALFLPLPVWTLYYFTRPHIKFIFASKYNNLVEPPTGNHQIS